MQDRQVIVCVGGSVCVVACGYWWSPGVGNGAKRGGGVFKGDAVRRCLCGGDSMRGELG